MTSPAQSVQREAVSPLELFFDLVFIFAVSQLSHHLLDELSWRGAAETLVLLIAVFGVWSGTSFEATCSPSDGPRPTGCCWPSCWPGCS